MGRDYPERPIVGVGAVVRVTADAASALRLPATGVVLIKRRHEPLAGEWSLPGGGVDVGETLVAAVAREVVEETGLTVEVGPVIEVFDRIMLDDQRRVQYHFVLVDYLCRPTGGRLLAGSDAADITIAEPAALESMGLSAKAVSVIGRGLALAEEREKG
jgi:ADP-ribose pyrophosphatase YjhB (NUDIX family)